MGLFSRAKLRSVDFYRKIPRDMSEGTVPGSVISIGSALLIGERGVFGPKKRD